MRRTVAAVVVASRVALLGTDEGQGPAILLLHGLGADHTIWNAVIPRLTPRFRVLAPDLPGHGRSPEADAAAFSFDALEESLLGWLDSKDVASAHLVGLSAGALLCLRLGLDHPDRVRSVCLIGGSVYTDGHTRAIAERWAETYAREGPDALGIRLLKDLYYPDWVEAHMDYADRVREEVARRDYRGAVDWGRQTASFDERARIASLRPPALMIQGMDDQVVDASHGRILRQSIPGSKIRIFAETGHMVPVERPEETAEAISTFVGEVEARISG